MTKLKPTPRTGHMIASPVLLERSLAFWTSLHLSNFGFGCSIIGGDLFSISDACVVVGAEFSFMPRDVVHGAGLVAAAATNEDGAVCTARVELSCFTSWRETVTVLDHLFWQGLWRDRRSCVTLVSRASEIDWER